MDMRTGEIAPLAEFEKRGVDKKFLRPILQPKLKEGEVLYGGQIVKPIDPKNLSKKVLEMVVATGKGYITRNSRCPCGSGKRFKRCCMMVE